LFIGNPQLQIIPVISDGMAIGIINRHQMIDQFARPFRRELHGKKSCEVFMETQFVSVDKNTDMQEVSQIIVDASPEN